MGQGARPSLSCSRDPGRVVHVVSWFAYLGGIYACTLWINTPLWSLSSGHEAQPGVALKYTLWVNSGEDAVRR